eukprot:1683995-Rhodomonas_salina.4
MGRCDKSASASARDVTFPAGTGLSAIPRIRATCTSVARTRLAPAASPMSSRRRAYACGLSVTRAPCQRREQHALAMQGTTRRSRRVQAHLSSTSQSESSRRDMRTCSAARCMGLRDKACCSICSAVSCFPCRCKSSPNCTHSATFFGRLPPSPTKSTRQVEIRRVQTSVPQTRFRG